MSYQLKKAIKAVGIETAKRIIAEMEGPPKWDYQQCSKEFLKIINGMKLRREPSRFGVNLWDGLVKGKRVTLFEQDLQTGFICCKQKHVWKLFEDHFSTERSEVQALLKDLIEEHLGWQTGITGELIIPRSPWLEEQLKWKVEKKDQPGSAPAL